MAPKKFVERETVGGVLVGRVLASTLSEYESRVVLADLKACPAGGEPSNRIVLNCEKVEMLASAGIGMFVTLRNQCKSNKGEFAVFGLNDEIVGVLKLTRMDSVFTIAQTQAEAIAAVS